MIRARPAEAEDEPESVFELNDGNCPSGFRTECKPRFLPVKHGGSSPFSLHKNLFIAFGNVLIEVYPSSVQELDAPVLQKGRIEFAGDF